MNDNEVLTAILSELQGINGRLDNLESRMGGLDGQMGEQGRILAKHDGKFDELRQEIRDSEQRMKLFIELRVEKKISALYDGYLGNHEKIEEHQREITRIDRRIDYVENKINSIA